MKKKNLFMSMLAMASMLFATSCSQDEVLNESATDDFVNATFTVSTSAGIETRAVVGDGTTVNYVACAVYNAANEEMTGLRQYVSLSDKKATYSVRLVKGQAYRVAFFAYNGQANGSSDYYDMTDLKNIQIKDAVSNLEARDAFTNYVDVSASETTVAVNKDVTLKRPFAQLNLGAYAADIEAARQAGIVVEKSKIKVTGVYKAFNAFENNVAGTTGDMTFDFNGLLSEKLKADVDGNGSDEEFDYLALNYLLVGGARSPKATTDVTFVWKTADRKTNNPATEFKNVPVQTNYRTNIVGYLLTNPANFNITIDETFQTPDHFVVLSAAELANEMIPVNGVINLTKDYVVTDAWTSLSLSGAITINGNGHKIYGINQPLVKGTGGIELTVNNLTIENANVGIGYERGLGTAAFISFIDASGKATFTNCHLLNSTVTGNERAAALISYCSGSEISITNCSAEGCTIKAVGGAGGLIGYTIATTNVADSKVENTYVEATEIRAAGKAAVAGAVIGTVNGATTFSNVSVNGNTVKNHSVNGELSTYNEKVGRVVSPGTLTDKSAAELANEMIPVNGVINLTKDYVVTGNWTPLVFSENITINGNGHTIQGLDKALVLRANGVNISINDLTIAKSNISYSASDATETALGVGGFISYMDYAGTATFNNCHLKNSTVNGNERAAGLIGYTSGNQLTVTNCTVEGCTIKATGSTGGIVAHTQNTVSISGSKVENSTIESTEDRSTKAAIAGGIIGTIMGATTFDNVTVSGNTVINIGATPFNEKVGRVVNPGSLTDN